jgi:hypothetical protein
VGGRNAVLDCKVIVRGRRVNAGGIVEMVGSLARLLRRAGLLRAKQPNAPEHGRSCQNPQRIAAGDLARLGAEPAKVRKSGGNPLSQRAIDCCGRVSSGWVKLRQETELPAPA